MANMSNNSTAQHRKCSVNKPLTISLGTKSVVNENFIKHFINPLSEVKIVSLQLITNTGKELL